MRTFDPMNLSIYLWSMVFMENHSFHTPWYIQTDYEIYIHPMIHMVFKYDKGKTSIFSFIKWFVGSKIVFALWQEVLPLWFATSYPMICKSAFYDKNALHTRAAPPLRYNN